MCKAFSALITKSGKVYWQAGLDSHDELQAKFAKKDKELKDDKLPPNNTFARVEIVPENDNYLNPNGEWKYKVDEEVEPSWLQNRHEQLAWSAFRRWRKELYDSFNWKEAAEPINPLEIKPPKIGKRQLRYLREWDSVWGSVWGSAWGSVGAYIGSLFPGIKTWVGVDRRKKPFNKIKGYPFRSGVWLWRHGLVPSLDGNIWRLHGGRTAEILWQGTVSDLKKEAK